MKRVHHITFSLLAGALFILSSCVEENTFDTTQYVLSFTPTVSTDVSDLEIDSNGGNRSIGISCNTSWTANSSASWLTLSSTSGTGKATLTMKVAANTDFSSRTGTITVACGGVSKTVSVNQAALERIFTLSAKSLNYLSSSSSRNLKITSNQSWKSSTNVSWISLSKTSGTGDATLSVTAEANTSTESRSGIITFRAIGKDYTVTVLQKGKLDTGSHEYVDLGLPSGLLWATCNVGASSPEDYGDYFAWGETTTKDNYSWETYKWCNGSYNSLTKYNDTVGSYGTTDNKTVLELSDDAAHVNWGGNWRMPTYDEFRELVNNCTLKWTTQGGHNGYKVTSNSNGSSIFLPAAGYRNDTYLDNAGSSGYYWLSSLSTFLPFDALAFDFDSSNRSAGHSYRRDGRSVRPVCP